ncbi:hypothetical protein CHUAL_007598 [Chamberlinius hualienensis]
MWKWRNSLLCYRKNGRLTIASTVLFLSVCIVVLVCDAFWWIHPKCRCVKNISTLHKIYDANSTCPSANVRGNHQNVLSFSFYGDTKSKYFKGVAVNAELIAKLYPGWTMRLYHNISQSDTPSMTDLCKEVCKFSHLDECYVGDIAEQFRNIESTFGMIWRFAVLGDPTVDMFGVRDLDSSIYQREIDAVNEWLKTGKTFHIMRDHPYHSTHILGGMWGAKNAKNITVMRDLFNQMLSEGNVQKKGHDQFLLSKYVWPIAKDDMVSHDSFLCEIYPNTTSWPTPRVNGTFVGDQRMWKWWNLLLHYRKNLKLVLISVIFFLSAFTVMLVFNSSLQIHPTYCCTNYSLTVDQMYDAQSTCPSANIRGNHQNVLSFSFYGDTKSKYFKGVAVNAELIAKLYPGWTMRLYHNISQSDTPSMTDLCKAVCKFSHLDECYVGDIAEQFRNIESTFGMIWRFAVLGDPTVDMFGVRDLDSQIYQREIDAVNDWLKTGKTFHIMRDNSGHSTRILGGMWGAKNAKNITVMRDLFNQMLSEGNVQKKGHDQFLLSKYVWPIAKYDMVSHDSFLCKIYRNTTPWPTPRVNGTFVGDTAGSFIAKPCPLRCRPKDHPDWIYC